MPASGGSLSDTNVPTNKVVKGQKHYLAYITPDEGKSLVDQGGQEVITDSGIPAYPPGMGDPAYAAAESSTNQGPAGGASAGGDYGGNVNPDQTYAGHTVQEQRDYHADPVTFVEKQTQEVEPTVISKIKSFVKGGSLTGAAIKLGSDVLTNIGKYSGDLQKKAMTYALNNKITSIGKKQDFHPGAYGYKIQDIQKDIDRIETGDFTQTDFNTKYGNPTIGGGEGGDGNVMKEIAPHAPYIIAGTTKPTNSPAQNWYQNLGTNTVGGPNTFNLATEFAAAKSKQQSILGNPSAVGMLAANETPYFDFLQKHSLTKGIL